IVEGKNWNWSTRSEDGRTEGVVALATTGRQLSLHRMIAAAAERQRRRERRYAKLERRLKRTAREARRIERCRTPAEREAMPAAEAQATQAAIPTAVMFIVFPLLQSK